MGSPTAPPPAPSSPTDILKDRGYLAVLIIGAALGIPVAVVAYFFLKVVAEAQQYFFTNLPTDLGFHGEPIWWPVPLLVLSGLLVALTVRYLPGPAGPAPARGGPTPPAPRGSRARRGIQAGRGGQADRSARHRDRVGHHAEPRCRAWSGGTADRHRERARRSRDVPAQEGRSEAGGDDHRCGRELRRDQHPHRRLAARGRPPAGGNRAARGGGGAGG